MNLSPSYSSLCAPRVMALLKHQGLESIITRFDGWQITAGGRSRLIRQTEIDRMAVVDDYATIDEMVRNIGLDLTAGRRAAQRRRAFRTRQRSIMAKRV